MSRLLPGRRGFEKALLAVTLLLLIGHVCALPELSHVILAEASAGDHTDGGSEADGSHIASCDATMSRSASCPPILGPGAPTIVLATAPRPERHVAVSLPVTGSPPPLFLLHASFLI